ncbi:MAG: hypothetical protein ACYDBB_18145 [Armatimonadota bacterium]
MPVQDNPARLSFPITEARVARVHGTPVALVNGEPLYIAMYCVRSSRTWGENPVAAQAELADLVREFAARGIHGYTGFFDLGWGDDGFTPAVSQSPRSPSIDGLMSAILAGDPDAYVVLMPNMYPPESWKTAHPEEFEVDSCGRIGHPSMASQVYQQTLAEGFAALVRYAESRPYAGHILGYNIQLGMEGFTAASFANAMADYSPVMQSAFRAWLHEQYASDAGLQQAWGDAEVTRDSAVVPEAQAQITGDLGVFRDPARSRRIIDFRRCVSDCAGRGVATILAATKNACDRKKLVGTYGNYLAVAGWPFGLFSITGTQEREYSAHAISGQSHWGRTLDNPDLDFVIANYDYYYRRPGGAGVPSNLLESITLHGKIAMMGDDTRTYLHTDESFGRAPSLDATRAVHRRNFACLATQAAGTQWVEQLANWLVDPPILDELGKLHANLQQAIRREAPPVESIAVILDEEAMHYETPRSELDWTAIYKQRIFGLAHCGVPVRFYLMSDLERDEYPRAKCYFFLNAWYADDTRRQMIADRLKRDGNVLVWLYGAGFCTPTGLDAEGMAALTDIRITPRDIRWEQLVTVNHWDHPITAGLPADMTFGTEYHLSPSFTVTDPNVTTLGAMLLPMGWHEPAFAVKDLGTHRSIYSATPALPATLLRNIARYAGCHIYNEENDVIHAGRGLLSLHAVKPGQRTLYLPRPSVVREMDSRKIIAEGATQFTVEVSGTSTQIFLVE